MATGETLRTTFLTLLLAACATTAVHAANPARVALERRFDAAKAAGRWNTAAAVADSLVRRRESLERLPPPRAASLLDSLGRLLFQAGSPEAWVAAERLFRAGLERRERSFGPDHADVASSLATLATLLDYLGRWQEAVPFAERAVAIRTRALGERRPATASSLRQLGLLHFRLGDYAAAGEPLERSLAIYQALGAGYEPRVADGHNNLGEHARVQDQLAAAESHFQSGLEVARARLAVADPVRLGLENNLAGLYKDLGRLDEAEPLLERALATLESSDGAPAERAIAGLNLAEVQRLQGRPAEAAPRYRRALEQARSALGDGHPDLVLFLNQRAVCEQELGHLPLADSLYRETGRIVESALGSTHPLMAQNLGDLARLRLASGHAGEADSLLTRAIHLREGSLGVSHPDVALLLVDQARARVGRDPDGETAALTRAISTLDSTRVHPDARLDAYALRAEWQSRRGQRAAAIADMAVALAAMDSLRLRRGGGDDTRAAFVAGRLGLLDRMVGWQIEQGDVEGALETHERGRARVLLDQIAASGVDLRTGIPAEVLGPLAAAERSAEARLAGAHRAIQNVRADPSLAPRQRLEPLAALASRRDSAAIELALARRRIEDASPVWRGVLSAEGRIPRIEELQRSLVPRDGLMLVYHVGRDASNVFAVPPRGRIEAFPLRLDPDAALALDVEPGPLTERTLERIVVGAGADSAASAAPGIAALLSGIPAAGYVSLPLRSATGPDAFERKLHALWRALVPEPLRRQVLSAGTATVIPDGALHLVAFEALVVRPRGRPQATTRYWLDDGPAITYGPSATSLTSLNRRPHRGQAATADRAAVLSVSDVSYALGADRTAPAGDAGRAGPSRFARTWRPLPGTALETRAIRTAFGSEHVQVLTGAAAREPAVRAALVGPRYLHIATHGFADPAGDRLQAGLVLAPPAEPITGSEDDGVLEMFEIHRLALSNELTVLSACETAKGTRVAGEGAFALARGFLAAGSRRVVASLWAVDDEPTARAVSALFGAIAAADGRGKRPDVARSLRDAKRRVREDPRWADPFYWAPFVLSGP